MPFPGFSTTMMGFHATAPGPEGACGRDRQAARSGIDGSCRNVRIGRHVPRIARGVTKQLGQARKWGCIKVRVLNSDMDDPLVGVSVADHLGSRDSPSRIAISSIRDSSTLPLCNGPGVSSLRDTRSNLSSRVPSELHPPQNSSLWRRTRLQYPRISVRLA